MAQFELIQLLLSESKMNSFALLLLCNILIFSLSMLGGVSYFLSGDNFIGFWGFVEKILFDGELIKLLMFIDEIDVRL